MPSCPHLHLRNCLKVKRFQQRLTSNVPVVESNTFAADDLFGFVSLAGDDDAITRLGDFDRAANGNSSVEFDLGLRNRWWKALENVCIPLKKGGLFFIALYNDQGIWSSFWKKVKKFYCSSQAGRMVIILTFIPFFIFAGFVKDMIRFKNPFERYTEYKKNRGMSVYYDWIDWLGGYPFEVAKFDEVVEFYRERGLVLLRKKTKKGWGNNEFVFKRIS